MIFPLVVVIVLSARVAVLKITGAFVVLLSEAVVRVMTSNIVSLSMTTVVALIRLFLVARHS